MRAALIAVALLMACAAPVAPSPDNTAPGAPSGEDSCRAASYAHLIGVHENEIDRASLPARARIVCPTCMVTQDYAPTRLNLHTSTEGRVASLRCG